MHPDKIACCPTKAPASRQVSRRIVGSERAFMVLPDVPSVLSAQRGKDEMSTLKAKSVYSAPWGFQFRWWMHKPGTGYRWALYPGASIPPLFVALLLCTCTAGWVRRHSEVLLLAV